MGQVETLSTGQVETLAGARIVYSKCRTQTFIFGLNNILFTYIIYTKITLLYKFIVGEQDSEESVRSLYKSVSLAIRKMFVFTWISVESTVYINFMKCQRF